MSPRLVHRLALLARNQMGPRKAGGGWLLVAARLTPPPPPPVAKTVWWPIFSADPFVNAACQRRAGFASRWGGTNPGADKTTGPNLAQLGRLNEARATTRAV